MSIKDECYNQKPISLFLKRREASCVSFGSTVVKRRSQTYSSRNTRQCLMKMLPSISQLLFKDRLSIKDFISGCHFILRSLLWVLLGCFSVSSVALAQHFQNKPNASSDLVRIRVKSNLKAVKLNGLQLQFQTKNEYSAFQTVAIPTISSAVVELLPQSKGAQKWKVQFPSLSLKDMVIASDKLVVRGEMIRIGMDPVPSTLYFYSSKRKNLIDVVAELNIESYLAGVLPSEMPASWPIEALKAQAVASRSYMRNVMNSRKAKHYHLEATIHDQVYNAMNLISIQPEYRQKIVEAIEETRGLYLAGKDNRVYRSFYHADCGGQTEEPERVWGIRQKNGTVKDSFCPQSPSSLWSLSVTKLELVERLKNVLKIEGRPMLNALVVTQRSPSGRIVELSALFHGHPSIHFTAQQLRQALGFNKLKSTNFSFQWFGEELRVSGQGHGHGVGMCQWGAKTLAQNGKSFRQILKRYYPNTHLQRESMPESDLLKVPSLLPSAQNFKGKMQKKAL